MASSTGHAVVANTIGPLFKTSEMFNCWKRRWIDVDGASHTLSATAAIFLGIRTVFGFSRFGLSMRMPVSFTFFTRQRTYGAAPLLPKFVSNFRIHSATLPWFSKQYRNISQRCSSVYTTIFVRRKDKTNYLSNQTWAKCCHSRNKHNNSLKKNVRLRTLYMYACIFFLQKYYLLQKSTFSVTIQYHFKTLILQHCFPYDIRYS